MQFSVFTLNLRHGQGPVKGTAEANWALGARRQTMRENAERLGDFLLKLAPSPDIICLQETNAAAFFWPDIVRIIQKRIGYPHLAVSARMFLPHNNAILSRLPFRRVLSGQFHGLELIRWGWSAFLYSANRGFVAAEIAGVGLVVSTHFDPYHEALRCLEARKLRRALEDFDPPLVMAGDFNSGRYDDEALRIATAGLTTSPEITAANFLEHATWPAGSVAAKRRLDYVFVSPSLCVISATRLSTGYSDHFGVFARVASR
ncbi:endonuclease/exonuclease/phosphatase family protein [Candidatus Parcubacteria bacterium]|nr:endonuclease/exonuclease/phosphatase family protein [Candidatus Parcubacteria bacterium]